MTTTTNERLDRIERLVLANAQAIKELHEHGKRTDEKLDRVANLILELAKRVA